MKNEEKVQQEFEELQRGFGIQNTVKASFIPDMIAKASRTEANVITDMMNLSDC